MLRFTSDHGAARFAFSDRRGGGSASPYHELNLGGHVGDDAATVAGNRKRAAHDLGVASDRVMYMNQVHGAEVATVDRPWDGTAPDIDAMVTAAPGLVLGVLVADCVPVLLADPSGVVGVAHAGRPGLAAGVVPAVVSAMRHIGARDIVAVIGPAVCGACYEVPPAMQDDVCRLVPEARSTTRDRTSGLDIRAGVCAQLAQSGVTLSEQVTTCTMEDPNFYSYRRDGVTGRFAGFAVCSDGCDA